ncbi:hypothetical protein TI05_00275 [Achromatium sp. WMS3]|nr:hypothetical protein TI05_00275 [Achromatium sp. WMS3]
MKPRNREINVFNLSMLDVIFGAMAAFLIIMVVLMPYYNKEHIDYQAIIRQLRQQLAAATAEAQAARQQAQVAQQQAQAAQQQAQEARQQTQAAQQQVQAANARAQRAKAKAQLQRNRAKRLAKKLANTFLVLFIRWKTSDDVDLHVVNPAGAEFYYSDKTIRGQPGELSEDNTQGPGNEVWEVRNAPPGNYKIYVKLFTKRSSAAEIFVQGRIFHRDGSSPLPKTKLTREKQKKLVVTIKVSPQGNVSIH